MVERLLAVRRKLVEQLSAVAPRTDRPDEPVTLEALQGRVDLADIDFPGPTQHRLKPVLYLIAVQRLLLQESQHAELKRQSLVYPYSVCMLSMHDAVEAVKHT